MGAHAGSGGEKSTRRERNGMDVSADTYAYTAWFNNFSAFIPPWAHDGGDASWWSG